MDTAIVILAAGQGKRMRSTLPKVLHPLGEKTLLGHALSAAQGTHPQKICVVVRHERDKVAAHIKEIAPEAVIADQDEIPGTGRAVWCAMQELAKAGPITGTVMVTSGDVPLLQSDTLVKLAKQHQESGAVVTIATAILDNPYGYGRVIRNSQGGVTQVVEERDATDEQRAIKEGNVGIYAFDAKFLSVALEALDSNNDQGEIYLTDTVEVATSAGKTVSALIVEDAVQVEGVNDPEQLEELTRIYESRKAGERDKN